MKRLLNTPHIISSSGCARGIFTAFFLKHRKAAVLAICILSINLSIQAQITSDQFNRGFEDGNTSAVGAPPSWRLDGGASTIAYNNTANRVRTGSFSGLITTLSTTNQKYTFTGGSNNTLPANQRVHVIGWVYANNISNVEYGAGIRMSGTDIPGSVSTTRDTWQRVTTNRLNGASFTAMEPYFNFRRTGTPTTTDRLFYLDNVVVYVHPSTTTDIVKPNAPSCLASRMASPSSIMLQWNNGTDAGTGVQGTLVLRTTTTNAGLPSLNDQGTYTTSAIASDGVNTVNTTGPVATWTIVGDVSAGITSFTDASVVAGTTYRYTIVHYDLALNYSAGATPINVNAGAVDFSQSVYNISKPTGGTFTPGDFLRINVSLAVPNGLTVHNIVARINIDPAFTYQAGSMKILDNKGYTYTSGTAATSAQIGCPGTYTQPGSFSALTDAADNDPSFLSSGYAEIILGEFPTASSTYANLRANVGNRSGGRIVGGLTKPRFYSSQTIIVASLEVQIPASIPIGSVIPITSALSYSFTETSTIPLKTTINIDAGDIDRGISIVVSDPALPASYSSRGANLFSLYSNGTFGQGTDTSGPEPNSSPNFIKTIIGPNTPNDGNFAVVKNTAANQIYFNNDSVYVANTQRVFRLWSILGDHTGATNAADGNAAARTDWDGGYALAVNADYVPKRFVSQSLTGLCPGTFYNFKAWFRNVCPGCGADPDLGTSLSTAYSDPRRQGVKPNMTFEVNNQAYYTTGPIDTADKWIQKEFVFSTGASSGNFDFSIRNNANGGDGNDWMMDDLSIITRGPTASAVVNADPFIDPNPASFCVGQRFQIVGNWLENTGSFSQYDSYQFQYSETSPTGPWTPIGAISELPSPNDPFNPLNGRLDSIVTPQFVNNNTDVYFRIVLATQPSNISLNDAAPCQVTAYNSSTIRIGTCVLPIKLLRFKAATFGQQVFLNWAAADVNRLQHYIIERSSDGVNFSAIKQVDAKAFASPYQYQLIDQPNTSSDRLWYRLKMVHLNNEITYSNIETVGWRRAALSLSIQPNPAKDVIQLNWSGVKPNQKIHLAIYTVSGKTVHTQTITVQQGPTQMLRLPALPAGLYMLQVEDPTSQYRQTIKLNKL